MKKFSIRDIVYISLMVALNVVLSRMLSIRIPLGGIEGSRIGFGGLPIIFAGIAINPLAGGIVGALGDLIGHFLSPMGPYMPQFTMSAALTGFIPGLVLKPFKRSGYTLWQLIMAIAIGQTITSIILVPYFMEKYFSVPMSIKVPQAITSQAIHVPIYAYLTKVIMKRLVPLFVGLAKE